MLLGHWPERAMPSVARVLRWMACAGDEHTRCIEPSRARLEEPHPNNKKNLVDGSVQSFGCPLRPFNCSLQAFDGRVLPFDNPIQAFFCPVQPCSCPIPTFFFRIQTLDGPMRALEQPAQRHERIPQTTHLHTAQSSRRFAEGWLDKRGGGGIIRGRRRQRAQPNRDAAHKTRRSHPGALS